MHKNSNAKKSVLIMIVLILLILTILFVYNSHLQNRFLEYGCNMLDEVMLAQKRSFIHKLIYERQTLTAYSNYMAEIAFKEEELPNLLKEFKTNTEFDEIAYTDNLGNLVDDGGEETYVYGYEFFDLAMQGKSSIFDVSNYEGTDNSYIYIDVPVYKEQTVCGVLAGIYKTQSINKVFLPMFNGSGYTYISDSKGRIIAGLTNNSTLEGNLLTAISEAEFLDYDDFETITDNLKKGIAGHSKYFVNDTEKIMHYSPTAINDWYIFYTVPSDVVFGSLKEITQTTVIFAIILILMVILFFLIMLSLAKRHAKEVARITYIDELTGFYNFKKFREISLNIVKRYTQNRYCVIKFDIVNFKLINEIDGYTTGDKILKEISVLLNSVLDKKTETFARINSDEFIVLSIYVDDATMCEKISVFEKVFCDYCNQKFDLKVIIKAGIYSLKAKESDFSEIFEKVNLAHSISKSTEDNTVIYSSKLKSLADFKKQIECKMADALKKEEFEVFLQPKYRLKDEHMAGVEALVRWHFDTNKYLFPHEFIPIFEKNNFITNLDMYMFESCCKILKGWVDASITPVKISVNFSGNHFDNANFVEELCALADKYQVPHNLLEIEMRESNVFSNINMLTILSKELHSNNFTLCMDNFGSINSSLHILKDIDFDVIKIDKRFFESKQNLKRAKPIISNIITMAKSLEITTVAQGIQSQDILDFVSDLGCDIVQGNYFAQPMPNEEFTKRLKDLD